MEGDFVAYYRVSTDRQGKSGLGLEAQRAAVEQYLNGGNWRIVGRFTEIETGAHNDRPKLAAALKACRTRRAKLVIAKLDRLSRDAHFLLGLEKAGVDFVAVDMPHANRLTVGIMALVADEERRMISARTKAALAAAKARGVKLGGDRGGRAPASARKAALEARQRIASDRASDIAADIEDIRKGGATSLQAIADALNARSIPAPRGGAWQPTQVLRVLKRLESR